MIKNLISVVMPTYNDAKYLRASIDDILSQTYSNFELIIVNDGSTDETQEILNSYINKDSRITIYNKENAGTGSALNYGFNKAKGEFGTWVSSDDSKNPEFLEKLVECLKNNRDIEFVCSAFYSSYLNTIVRAYCENQSGFLKLNISQQHLHDSKCSNKCYIVDDWANLNYQSCMLGTCFMFTMNLKNKMGDYINIPGEDYYMTMKMAFNTRVAYLDTVLGTHNNPPDSLSMKNRECVIEANLLTRKLYLEKEKWNFFKIPKIANFYWGSEKMSFLRYLTIFSFKKMNPDWSIHLYIPSEISKQITWKTKGGDNHHKIDNLEYDGEDYYKKLIEDVPMKIIKVDFSNTFLSNQAPEPHKSDLLTWQVLSSKGGLWCDMDILFVKPVTKLLLNKQNIETDTIVCYDDRILEIDGSPTKPIGFLFSSPKNNFYGKILLESKKCYTDYQYQSIGTNVVKRVANTFEECSKTFFHNKFQNLDANSVYYFHFQRINDIYESELKLPENIIGIHWYGGHPKSQEFNKIINDKNYKLFNNTIANAIKEVME